MKNRIELIALLPVLQSFAETDVRQREILDVFEEICAVPRYSSFEVRIGNWLTTWEATNGVIEVPAPWKQGFFILKSKAASTERAATHEPWYVPIE